MRRINVTATGPIENVLVLKKVNMERTINLKTFKFSTANINSKPLPGDKTLGIEPAIRFNEIKDSDKTE